MWYNFDIPTTQTAHQKPRKIIHIDRKRQLFLRIFWFNYHPSDVTGALRSPTGVFCIYKINLRLWVAGWCFRQRAPRLAAAPPAAAPGCAWTYAHSPAPARARTRSGSRRRRSQRRGSPFWGHTRAVFVGYWKWNCRWRVIVLPWRAHYAKFSCSVNGQVTIYYICFLNEEKTTSKKLVAPDGRYQGKNLILFLAQVPLLSEWLLRN